jgi:hypothetical protein
LSLLSFLLYFYIDKLFRHYQQWMLFYNFLYSFFNVYEVLSQCSANVCLLLFDSSDPEDPTVLHELAATRYATDKVSQLEFDDDGTQVEIQLSFPFPDDAEDPTSIFADQKVAALPVAVPLPPGHNLDPVRFTDSVGLNDFLDRLASEPIVKD